jgi:HlyD family secretion protein
MSKQLCLLIVLTLVSHARPDDDAKDKPQASIPKQKVEQKAIEAKGTLEPEEVIDVGAQVAGMVQKLGTDPEDSKKTIDYGTRVEEGTILAQLDSSAFQARVEQAKAQLRLSQAKLKLDEAQLAHAEHDRERAENAVKKQQISREQYDAAAANVEVAKARLEVGKAGVEKAQALLKEAEINLGYTTIRSPVAGVILDRRVNVGQTVAGALNAPSLFLITKDIKRLLVLASVNEADITQIKPGQRARFTISAFPMDVFTGKVTQVRLNAGMVQNVVTYTVVVETDNPGGKLLPYLTANVRFLTDHP